MRKLGLIMLAALILPVALGAQEHCKWLNEATAAGVLGGAVKSAVTHTGTGKDDASCYFAMQRGSVTHAIRIEVLSTRGPDIELASYAPLCKSEPVSLRAISNETFTCTMDGGAEQHSEQVVGRVRDHVLIIRVSANDQATTANSLRENAVKIAGHVAGNLF